jgi:hypothetical protein
LKLLHREDEKSRPQRRKKNRAWEKRNKGIVFFQGFGAPIRHAQPLETSRATPQ